MVPGMTRRFGHDALCRLYCRPYCLERRYSLLVYPTTNNATACRQSCFLCTHTYVDVDSVDLCNTCLCTCSQFPHLCFVGQTMPGNSHNHACCRGPQCTRHAATAAGDLSSQWAHKNSSCSAAAIRASPASRACMGHVLRCSFGRNHDSLQTARSMMPARWEYTELPVSEEAEEWDGVLPPQRSGPFFAMLAGR